MPYLLVLLSLFIITGCVPQQQNINLTNTFDVEQAKKALVSGNNTIKGNSFLKQNGGGVVTCAGNGVDLIPNTEYAKERIRNLYNNTERGFRGYNAIAFIPDNQDYHTFMKKTTCDSQGNFKFDNVADGDYFITTTVIWTVGYAPQGGALMQKVSVNNGELKEIVLAF